MDLHWVSEQLISPQPSRRMTGYESDPEGAAWSRIHHPGGPGPRRIPPLLTTRYTGGHCVRMTCYNNR
jgi:hypothetical protein